MNCSELDCEHNDNNACVADKCIFNKDSSVISNCSDKRRVNMKLTIADRLNIIYGLLPEKGNMIDMAMSKEVNSKIEFDSEEIERIGLKPNETGNLSWDSSLDSEELEVDFKAKELVFLERQVDRLDSENKITNHLFSICNMIKEEVNK